MQLIEILVPIILFGSISAGILCCFIKDKDEDYHPIYNKKRINDEESV
jgi:hypothetical protein